MCVRAYVYVYVCEGGCACVCCIAYLGKTTSNDITVIISLITLISGPLKHISILLSINVKTRYV